MRVRTFTRVYRLQTTKTNPDICHDHHNTNLKKIAAMIATSTSVATIIPTVTPITCWRVFS